VWLAHRRRATTGSGRTLCRNSHKENIMRVGTRVGVIALAAGLAATAAPVSASAHASTAVEQAQGEPESSAVGGLWHNSDPIAITSTVKHPAYVTVTFTGASRWSGDLTGPTSYSARARVDQRGALTGVIHERFTGRLADVGTGTLTFTEHFRQDPTGALTIDAQVTAATGQLAGVRGTLHFTGHTDQQGVGGDRYTGHLSESDD